MTPEILCLCEGATVKNGQLCILHTLANCSHVKFPALIQLVLVAQVRFMQDEDGDHDINFVMTDMDGRVIWALPPLGFVIKCPKESSRFLRTFMLQAEFMPGQHELTMFIDNKPANSILLWVYDSSKSD